MDKPKLQTSHSEQIDNYCWILGPEKYSSLQNKYVAALRSPLSLFDCCSSNTDPVQEVSGLPLYQPSSAKPCFL